jgi:hypothetical protein
MFISITVSSQPGKPASSLVAMGLVFLLGFATRAFVSAQETPTASPAATAKSLGPADSRRVEELETTIDRLDRSAKFAEAVAPAQEMLGVAAGSP